jgi:hypothetical protein
VVALDVSVQCVTTVSFGGWCSAAGSIEGGQ